MDKLENFYKVRSEYPEFISEEEWNTKEIETIQESLSPQIKQFMNSLLKDVKCPLTFNVAYDGNKVVDVSVERQPVAKSGEEDATAPIRRGESVGFAVYFPDGTVVKRSKAKDTFVAALQVIGLNRVAGFRGKTFAGFPLVTKTKRMKDDHKYQEKVDGWYVYINMNNNTKKEVLQQLSSEMKLGLVIKDDDGRQANVSEISRVKGKRQMFLVDGDGPYNKRLSVLATVRKYLELHPDATEQMLQKAFPADLQGSLGVVRNITWIQGQLRLRKEVTSYFFISPDTLITTAEGEQLAVCNQWGNNFAEFMRAANAVGILIEKA